MSETAIRPEALQAAVAAALGEQAQAVTVALGEVTVTVSAANYLSVMQTLRDAVDCRFEQLIDLCGMD